MRLKFEFLLLFCAGPFCPSQAVQAPPAGANASAIPTIHQTVNSVVVDVVVTNKDGQPIRGLSKEQFQILENGVAQQIDFFEEHQFDPKPAPIAPPPPLPPNVYTNLSETAPESGPALILLMDGLNTASADQVAVRTAMLNYLRKIPKGRTIAIFTLTSKLRMLQGFSSDPAPLLAALDQVAAWQKSHSRLNDDPGQDSYADFMQTGAPMVDAQIIANFISHEQPMRMDERVADTLNALNALAAYLSVVPGRKNLIWFSGSFPISMGDSSDLEAARNYDADLRKTADLLKLARVAVYPIDPGAIAAPAMFSSTKGEGGPFIIDQAASTIDSHRTSDTIAESTGGRAFHGTTNLADAIEAVALLGSSYYTLSYVPANKKYDGKYRKLIVKVDSPKATLDYRRGYYADNPEKPGAAALAHPSRTDEVLLHGGPAATDIGFSVQVVPSEGVTNSRAGMIRYSVNWSIDLKSIGLVEAPDGSRRGTLTFNLIAYDRDSKPVNTSTVGKLITLSPDQYEKYQKTPAQFHQDLDLPIGLVYLRAGIVNTDNNRAGAIEIPMNVRPQLVKTDPVDSDSVTHP